MIKKGLWGAWLLVAALAACTSYDSEMQSGGVSEEQVIAIKFNLNVTPFDVTTRAASEWQWADGAVVYLQFYNGTNRIYGQATYTKSTDTWTLTSKSGTLGTADRCEVYYFDGASTDSKTSVTLGPSVGIYTDQQGSYVYDSGVLGVSASLKPLTGRIRFLRDASTSVSSISVNGLTTYTAYDATTNTLTSSDASFSATVQSTGYTPYVYGSFTDSQRQLSMTNNVDGRSIRFECTFGTSVMQTGHSGYITIPTNTSRQGWKVVDNTTGTEAGHEWVDLGLPSGLLWATTNVGASIPADYGNYYAWGETTTKTSYNWSTYKYCIDGDYKSLIKYNTSSSHGTVDNKTVLEATDDAATANWGGKWRMPTYDELYELNTKCTWKWTTQNGHDGYQLTGPNGKSIFLPAAGCYRATLLYDGGFYWSSSLITSSPYAARYLYFYSSEHYTNGLSYERQYGYSVRPVLKP